MSKAKPRLKEKYEKVVARQLAKEFGIDNPMAVPKVVKVVINIGIGDALKNKELLEQVKKDLAAISGQVANPRPAKVSVSSFSVRRGMIVGLRVTLRGDRMYFFLDKLCSIVLPRLRDFRGLSRESFDKLGNYTLGITEGTVFPEVDMTKSQAKGLEITVVTSGGEKEKSMRLLELLGMPFEKEQMAKGKS